MRKCFLGIYLILFNFYESIAQIQKDVITVQSPNSASFNYFGNHNVNLFDGTVDINIPLYSLTGNRINDNLNLVYKSSGVKTDDHPGTVGLNWNLNVGGVITRSIQGYPDELNSIRFPQLGYYFNGSVLANSNWSSTVSLEDNQKRDFYSVFKVSIPPKVDTEPDVFYFNIPSKQLNGKFYFDHNQEIKVQCNKNVKVIFENDFIDNHLKSILTVNNNDILYSKTFKKFIIVDEEGSRFTFGNDAIEYSDALEGRLNVLWAGVDGPQSTRVASRGIYSFANSWYLISYENATENISYNYVRGAFIADFNTQPFSTRVNADGHASFNLKGVNASGKFISPVYLKNIIFNKIGLKINFLLSKSNQLVCDKSVFARSINYPITNDTELQFLDRLNNTDGLDFFNSTIPNANNFYEKLDRLVWPKLDIIEIVNFKNNSLLRKIKLNYIENSAERLKLKEVVFFNRLEEEEYKYQLFYNVNKQPNYSSCFNDLAGYNNAIPLPGIGVYGSYVLSGDDLSSYTPNLPIEKSASASSVKAESLEKIIYPNSGYTLYDFEINDYSKIVSDNRSSLINEDGIIGGLRIKKISDYNWDGTKVLEKEYLYKSNYEGSNLNLKSSGVLNLYPRLEIGPYYITQGSGTGAVTYLVHHKSATPAVSVSLEEESLKVTYTEVIEKTNGRGYTKNIFSNFDNGYGDEIPLNSINSLNTVFVPYTSKAFERGQILNTEIYDASNNLIQHTENQYIPVYSGGENFVRSVFSNFKQVGPSALYERSSSAIKRYLYTNKISESTTIDYVLNEPTNILKTSYEYDERKNLKALITENSLGEKKKIIYRYPYNIISQSLTSSNNLFPYSYMCSTNVISPIEVITTKSINSEEFITSSKVTKFRNFPLKDDNGNDLYFPLVYSEYEFNSPNSFLYVNYNLLQTNLNEVEILDSSLELKKTFNYDTKGNISCIKIDNALRTYLWDYNKHYLVSETKNASENEIYYEGFEESNHSEWGINIYPTGSYGWPLVFDSSKKHSGEFSGMLENTNPGWESVSHSNKWLDISLSVPKKFRYSGWVYSNGPQTELFLFMKRAGETGYYSYVDNVHTTEINKWVYLDKEVSVPADVTAISIRVDVKSLGKAWFDDLRIHPSDSEITTYTYKPLVGMTSMTDTKGLTTYYEYDGFQRLKSIKDSDGNIVKSYDYHYRPSNP
jgi:YD repeat-containing protein